MLPTTGGCTTCDRLWAEYARLVEARLALIHEQRADIAASGWPLGLRIQATAEAQMQVRRHLAAHGRAHARSESRVA